MKRTTILCSIILAGLIGCSSPQKQENTQQEVITAAEPPSFQKIINETPKPTNIPVLLERSGVDFMTGLTNSDEKAEEYLLTNDVAALNLGIYSTDLGYLCVYEKAEEAIEYFKASQKLGDKLGITGAFDPNLMASFQNNLANKDSMVVLVNKSSDLVKTFLEENEQYNTASMIVTGSFIEGLYLSISLIENFPAELASVKDQVLVDLMRTVLEQKQTTSDIIGILEPIENQDKQAKNLLAGLRPLLKEYEKLNMDEKIKDNTGGLQIKSEDLKEISRIVKDIRGKIVG